MVAIVDKSRLPLKDMMNIIVVHRFSIVDVIFTFLDRVEQVRKLHQIRLRKLNLQEVEAAEALEAVVHLVAVVEATVDARLEEYI